MATITGVKHTKTKDAAVLKPKYCFLTFEIIKVVINEERDASAPRQTQNSSVLGRISSVETAVTARDSRGCKANSCRKYAAFRELNQDRRRHGSVL